jgi:hypothetical protein
MSEDIVNIVEWDLPHPDDDLPRCEHALTSTGALHWCSTHGAATGVMCTACATLHVVESHRGSHFWGRWPMRHMTLTFDGEHDRERVRVDDPVLLRVLVDDARVGS